jgi:dihydrofolate synthase/folylpolyglutamate synthase
LNKSEARPVDLDMDPLAYLLSLERLGIKFGLDNIRALAGALGQPQDAYRSVIVAGTNGKGSVAAMTERALRASGFKTGLYTSPHLTTLGERFVVNGSPVEPGALEAATAVVQSAIHHLRADGGLAAEPTFFEATTAIAFELFRRAAVDVAVLEVGMGGRFDATNIASPMAAAITTIDLDHQAFLGNSIPEIAFEKAGVIKPGMTVIVGESKREAVEVIARACEERGAEMVRARDGVRARAVLEQGRVRLELATPRRDYGTVVLALRGLHQVDNAVVAVRLVESLEKRGIDVPKDAIRLALTGVKWRARIELVDTAAGPLLVDAAHNPAGVAVLADYLRAIYPQGLPIVFGAMRDKDLPGMLAALLPCATRLVATAPPAPRAATPDTIAEIARRLGHVPVDIVGNPVEAVARARSFGSTVCVTGSIYLIGDIMAALPATS